MIIFKSLKTTRTLAALSALAIFGSAFANASLLNPGSTITLRSAHEPEDGRLVAQTNFAFTSASFTGTLASKVWADDESNPWGGLTFSYRLASTSDCAEPLGLFSLRGFTDSLVDVNYSGSGIAPRKATRSALGNTITFGFFDRDGDETLLPGSTSAWLVVQTGCDSWGLNQRVGMDSLEVTAATFAPVAVPEPTVGALVLMASTLGALVAKRRKA